VALPFGKNTIAERKNKLKPVKNPFQEKETAADDAETAPKTEKPSQIAAAQKLKSPVVSPAVSPTRRPSTGKAHPGSPPCVNSTDPGHPGGPPAVCSLP